MQPETVKLELETPDYDREELLEDTKRRAAKIKRDKHEAALAHAESILEEDELELVDRIMGRLETMVEFTD